ncbi:hypothetical protein Hanom_Chr00s007282g01737411 [Helianthus anomalus]
MLKTLPKGNGWRVQHLYNYNGFWLDSNTLKTNMILHRAVQIARRSSLARRSFGNCSENARSI